MEKYRIEQEGEKVTIYDNTEGVGLRFTKGETLQRYTSEIVLVDTELLRAGIDKISEVAEALTEYAAKLYPEEFGTIKT